MTQHNAAVNRTLAGLLALGCGLAGVALCSLRGIDDPFGAGFIRAGLVLGALWCAMPTRTREAAWARVSPYAVIGIAIAIVLFVRHLRVLLPLALVIAVVSFLLRPRKGRSTDPSRYRTPD